MYYIEYMRQALELAEKAYSMGEVPVGCVVVSPEGKVIGRGYNRREEKKTALSHAETEAIAQACGWAGDWRLEGCGIYVTLEPCPMCAGAVIQSRLDVLVYGAKEPVSGSCGSVVNLFMEGYKTKTAVYGGVLEDESRALLGRFFQDKRRGSAY